MATINDDLTDKLWCIPHTHTHHEHIKHCAKIKQNGTKIKKKSFLKLDSIHYANKMSKYYSANDEITTGWWWPQVNSISFSIWYGLVWSGLEWFDDMKSIKSIFVMWKTRSKKIRWKAKAKSYAFHRSKHKQTDSDWSKAQEKLREYKNEEIAIKL